MWFLKLGGVRPPPCVFASVHALDTLHDVGLLGCDSHLLQARSLEIELPVEPESQPLPPRSSQAGTWAVQAQLLRRHPMAGDGDASCSMPLRITLDLVLRELWSSCCSAHTSTLPSSGSSGPGQGNAPPSHLRGMKSSSSAPVDVPVRLPSKRKVMNRQPDPRWSSAVAGR